MEGIAAYADEGSNPSMMEEGSSGLEEGEEGREEEEGGGGNSPEGPSDEENDNARDGFREQGFHHPGKPRSQAEYFHEKEEGEEDSQDGDASADASAAYGEEGRGADGENCGRASGKEPQKMGNGSEMEGGEEEEEEEEEEGEEDGAKRRLPQEVTTPFSLASFLSNMASEITEEDDASQDKEESDQEIAYVNGTFARVVKHKVDITDLDRRLDNLRDQRREEIGLLKMYGLDDRQNKGGGGGGGPNDRGGRDSREGRDRDSSSRRRSRSRSRDRDRERRRSRSRDRRRSRSPRERRRSRSRDRSGRRDRDSAEKSRGREEKERYGRDKDRFGRDRDEKDRYGRDRDDKDRYGRDREDKEKYGRDREEKDKFGRERDRFGRDKDRFGRDRPEHGRDRDDKKDEHGRSRSPRSDPNSRGRGGGMEGGRNDRPEQSMYDQRGGDDMYSEGYSGGRDFYSSQPPPLPVPPPEAFPQGQFQGPSFSQPPPSLDPFSPNAPPPQPWMGSGFPQQPPPPGPPHRMGGGGGYSQPPPPLPGNLTLMNNGDLGKGSLSMMAGASDSASSGSPSMGGGQSYGGMDPSQPPPGRMGERFSGYGVDAGYPDSGSGDNDEPFVQDMVDTSDDFQNQVMEEIRSAIRPFFHNQQISKDDYREILKKCFPKVTSSGEINPKKIANLVGAYVKKVKGGRPK